jgi:hypothetical protein
MMSISWIGGPDASFVLGRDAGQGPQVPARDRTALSDVRHGGPTDGPAAPPAVTAASGCDG